VPPCHKPPCATSGDDAIRQPSAPRARAKWLILGTALALGSNGAALAQSALGPLATAKTTLVPFENSPFPYRGEIPEKNRPFIDTVEGERRGHASPRGGVYWEDTTYSDRRSLLHIPKGFDPRRPALIVIYFHGNEARLTRDVRTRQQVPRQLAESRLNAVLVAPQFAVDALDSSAGQFWQPGAFKRYVDESADRLTRLYGDARVRATFARAPIVIAAYSGGYHPTAFILKSGTVDDRIRGIMLLDGPFGDVDKFAGWLARRPAAFFVSAYGKAAREENGTLQRLLIDRGISFDTTLPPSLDAGKVAFIDSPDTIEHADFVTEAWVKDPLKALLRRVPGFPRTGGPTTPGSMPKGK
jgi:hypothetical protein